MLGDPSMSDLLLEASDVVKTYGAVRALRGASLAVRPGEVHALLGANGAGKSTLVKVLTGAIRPDGGRIVVKGQERHAHSPADARRSGVVTVYQEPSLIPDLDIASNLRFTATPVDAFETWMSDLGLPGIERTTLVRELPLATLRIIDLARALAGEPDVLMLDEMTAALPADLSEKVLEIVARQRATGRSVVFISHRLLEIATLCDRATVLRDGETVGVLDVVAGAEERILDLMLGAVADDLDVVVDSSPAHHAHAGPAIGGQRRQPDTRSATPRLIVRGLHVGSSLNDVRFELHAGEVLGLAALEGQGQDQLFDVLAGSRRPDAGDLLVDGRSVRFGHPADAIGAGLVYIPANRVEALLMQRSVRENIALPFSAALRSWGPIDMGAEGRRVHEAIERLQIDTRAQGEVRRLSGGNQQKVTIARWIAGGVRTLLCFDPTRGIDIGTKRQIYQLLRDLAEGGAAVLLYTSELEEIRLVCDRAIVMFGGRVVAEIPAEESDEPTLMRAAHGLPGRAAGDPSGAMATTA
jgi:ribose transport system ATP-binding protein